MNSLHKLIKLFLAIRRDDRADRSPCLTEYDDGRLPSKGYNESAIHNFRYAGFELGIAAVVLALPENLRMADGGPPTRHPQMCNDSRSPYL